MAYLGDFAEDYATLNTKFTTVSTGAVPTTLIGSPVISVYKANGTTESTAGVTLTVDFDSRTGAHNVLIDLSSDAFYSTGNDYQIMLTAGTVDSISVVGYVVGEFSIENRFVRGTDSAATAASLATAQLDLDKITGTDGVTLATAQALYAPMTLTGALTEAYSVKGAAPTPAQFMCEVLSLLRERSISSTTETLNGLDGTTPKMTNTLNDSNSPTAVTRAT
jgi:hypothetical protein